MTCDPFNADRIADIALAAGWSIEWCTIHLMPEVGAKMVRDVGGAWEFERAMKKIALLEFQRLCKLRI